MKELHSRTTNVTPSSSTRQCKVVNDDHETQHRPISFRKLNNKEGWMAKDIQCQLPPKELNPGNFTLPCTIGNFNFYGMADLGASVNVMPRNTFEYLRLANLRNTNMLVEKADMTNKAPLGIVKNPLSRSFYDYKWVFDFEIDQLDVHRDSTYWWHDHGFEEEERDEMGIEIEKYDPPEV
ncbi:putative reverse transcriptase domain-containing protein [Tanacetum coccineum]